MSAVSSSKLAFVMAAVFVAACEHSPGQLESPRAIAAALEDSPPNAVASSTGWLPAENIGPVVNSAFVDQTPELSKDGLSLYFASNRPGGYTTLDLWVSQRSSIDAPWGPPQNLGPVINSSGAQAAPHLTRDGHWLYFASNRAGGFGSFDVMVSWREDVHDDFAWQTPVNVGPPVNTSGWEGKVTNHGNDFFFPSGPVTGPLDLYQSELRDGVFQTPTLISELSTAADERAPSIRYDGREIAFVSNRPGGLGNSDIWVSTRSGDGRPWSSPVNLGVAVNSAFNDTGPSLSDDGELLFFDSNRAGGSGGQDLWVARRAPR